MTRVFIYGGCASRDAERYYPRYGMKLVGYVSRQSLPSALNPANTKNFVVPASLPKFQHRMIRNDIAGNLPRMLIERGPDIDLLVWDLNIERSGFYKLPDDSIVTRNGAQLKSCHPPLQSVPFGSEEHFRTWKISLQQFSAILHETGLFNKTVVNATPWAEPLVSPDAAPERQISPHTFNETIQEYWQYAKAAGIKIAHVSPKKTVADPNHKWGPAYFHYKPKTYKAQVKQLAHLSGIQRKLKIPTKQSIKNLLDRHV